MRDLSIKEKAMIILLFLVIGIAISIYFIVPIGIVGEYPMLTALITYASLIASFYGITTILFQNKPKKEKLYKNLLLAITVIGFAGAIPGVLLTGIKYKKAKSIHLVQNGIVTNALIKEKISRGVSRRGRQSEGFEIYFDYQTIDKQKHDSWDIVSEEEFFLTNTGNSILVIYSIVDNDIVDLIISEDSQEIYKDNIQKFLNK